MTLCICIRPISELDILFLDMNNLFTTTFVSKVSLLTGFKGCIAALTVLYSWTLNH